MRACADSNRCASAIVEPVGLEHRGQDPIGGVSERRVPVAQEPAKGRVGRLEQEQVVEARLDAQAASRQRVTVLVRVSRVLPAEGVGMLAAVDANPLQRLFGQADGRLRDVGMIGEEMARHRRAEVLDRFQRMLSGQRIGDVFHGVGGDDQPVVAARVRAGEIALELDLDRQLADVVAVGQAGDLGQANPRLSVGMLGENGGHDRIPPHRSARLAVTRPIITPRHSGVEWDARRTAQTSGRPSRARSPGHLRSRRVVTPSGMRPAAVVIAGETIVDVIDPERTCRHRTALHDVGDRRRLAGPR